MVLPRAKNITHTFSGKVHLPYTCVSYICLLRKDLDQDFLPSQPIIYTSLSSPDSDRFGLFYASLPVYRSAKLDEGGLWT